MTSSENESVASDSEVDSDEDVEESLQIAVPSVKKSLQIDITESRSSTDVFIKDTHKKIYDSFDSDDDDDPIKNDKSDTSEEHGEVTTSFDTFMIDKGGTDNVNSEVQQTEVFTVDFSKLEDETKTEKDKSDKKSKASKNKKKTHELSSSLEVDLNMDDLYIELNPFLTRTKKGKKKNKEKKQKETEPEIMKKSVMTDDYERQATIPTGKSQRAQKKERRVEKEKTKGSKWFEMPAQEVTEEKKNDFLVYQMRRSLDPKRFYKTTDAAGIPKYYHTGTVVEHAADFYDSRIPKKQRKANMVEELLADAKFRQYNKRKYTEIQEAKRHGTGPYNTMKKLKKKRVK